MRRGSAGFLALLSALVVACAGSTGSHLVTFDAAAAGPRDAVAGQPLDFVSGRGFHVTLSRARLHVGAIYLNQSQPVSGAQETSCVLPGTYVAEVTTGVDVDLLSPALQPFPVRGTGNETVALVGEVWLTGGDVNAEDDPTPILDLAGTVDVGGTPQPFSARITIGANRAVPPSDPAQPGSDPMCKQRIVSPVPAALIPRADGTLVLRVDPRQFFLNLDFAQLHDGVIADESVDQPSRNLYQALHAAGVAYAFSWE